MQINGHSIIVRSAHAESVRIIGLNEDERDKLAKLIRKFRDRGPDVSIVISYTPEGWLEVREGGIFKYPYKERARLTNALKERIEQMVTKKFPRK
jgi:hypothetical protein